MRLNKESDSLEAALAQGLTKEEYELINKMLGRRPTPVELGIFAVMWSEHCSYKSSRKHLKGFPTKGKHVLQGPGENAGIIDFGENCAVVFKMESHNHPSYIEPYQGAATGIGGILRDIFTMGARPIALMDSLRFGEISHPRMPYLLEGVVSGIAGYGNCVGIPTVGGETYFRDTYNGNILVNVFCLGILDKNKIYLGKATGPGNRVIYLGSKTGRDGIHGATMASEQFSEATEEKRPTVQVGDPFTKKLLLEACLEIMGRGLVEGIQDMGAAGLTCACFEMASRGSSAVEVELNKVPKREEGMTPYEIMLSESQERMLLVARPRNVEEILKISRKWGLDACDIGEVLEGSNVKIKAGGETVCDIRAKYITDESPVYDRPSKPALGRIRGSYSKNDVPRHENIEEALLKMLKDPNFAYKEWIYSQYDHMVGTDTVILPGSDAAVMRIKGQNWGIAMSVDCNSHYCYLDPYVGGKIAVAEAARNVVCSGAKPMAITDCLNFGNPENPEIMWEFKEVIKGISEGCMVFETPVTGGNVSFYNETNGKGIYPTPTVGMVGKIDDISKTITQWFKDEGDSIALIGNIESEEKPTQSEYLRLIFGIKDFATPPIDLNFEKRLHDCILALAKARALKSAHDCSEGGILLSLVESCMNTRGCKHGINVKLDLNDRPDIELFSEIQSRVIVSFHPDSQSILEKECKKSGIGFKLLGKVEGDTFEVRGYLKTALSKIDKAMSSFFSDFSGKSKKED